MLAEEIVRVLGLLQEKKAEVLDRFPVLCRELELAQLRLTRNHGGRVLRAIRPLPGGPNPVLSRVRSFLELVFACRPSLRKIYGRGRNEGYFRLLARRYISLVRGGLLGCGLSRG
jgi:hypothetical protein